MFAQLKKEPLVHFLLGAVLVFAFFWVTELDRDVEDYSIKLDSEDINRLSAGWIQNFRRPPTKQELDSLIDQEIREEIYYREALRLGLDVNDVVIKRRLSKKMKFLYGEDGSTDNPSDAVLQSWLDDHREKYALSARYDLEQVYLGESRNVSAELAQEQAEKVNRGLVSIDSIRKPLSLPSIYKDISDREITRQFGEKFAADVARLKAGEWTGPVQSGFGIHLVRINRKTPGEAATLDQVRQAVTNDWRAAENSAREEKEYQRMLRQYDVEVAGRK